MRAIRVTLSDPHDLASPSAELAAIRGGAIALHEWMQHVDISFPVHIVFTISVPTAAVSLIGINAPIELNPFHFVTFYEQSPTYLPGDPVGSKSVQERIAAHEIGHKIFGLAFDQFVKEGPDGGLVFTGPRAMAANGGLPVNVSDDGFDSHISNGKDGLETDVMSGYGFVAKTATKISKIAEAIAYDCGWSPPAPISPGLPGLYIASFNRAPDAAGLAYWDGQVKSGASLTDVAVSFSQQPEWLDRFGGQPAADMVDAVYRGVLGRAADAGGALYWRDAIDAGDVSPAAFVLAVLEGARAFAADAQYLASREAVGEYFVGWNLDDVAQARAVMAIVDGTASSVAAAERAIDAYALSTAGLVDAAT